MCGLLFTQEQFDKINVGQHLRSFFTKTSGHTGHTTYLFRPGLPEGLFSNQKSLFGYIWEGLRLENVYIFYGNLEYFMEIWDVL
jgi:hypothetical protein